MESFFLIFRRLEIGRVDRVGAVLAGFWKPQLRVKRGVLGVLGTLGSLERNSGGLDRDDRAAPRRFALCSFFYFLGGRKK